MKYIHTQKSLKEDYTLNAVADRLYSIFGADKPAIKSEQPEDNPLTITVRINEPYGSVQIYQNVSNAGTDVQMIKFNRAVWVNGSCQGDLSETLLKFPYAGIINKFKYGSELTLNNKVVSQEEDIVEEQGTLCDWFFENSKVAIGSTEYLKSRKLAFSERIQLDSPEELHIVPVTIHPVSKLVMA